MGMGLTSIGCCNCAPPTCGIRVDVFHECVSTTTNESYANVTARLYRGGVLLATQSGSGVVNQLFFFGLSPSPGDYTLTFTLASSGWITYSPVADVTLTLACTGSIGAVVSFTQHQLTYTEQYEARLYDGSGNRYNNTDWTFSSPHLGSGGVHSFGTNAGFFSLNLARSDGGGPFTVTYSVVYLSGSGAFLTTTGSFTVTADLCDSIGTGGRIVHCTA